ncbi:MAG: single-stranded DNA-binding protein [Armatimonadota bacterium]
MSDAHLNAVIVTGFATRDPVLRHKSSGQVKAEFSFEVNRPFYRATGEPVSDLFLVDAWEDIGEWVMDNIKEDDRMLIIGTLNKESYSTRAGREHLTIIKAKYIVPMSEAQLSGHLDTEQLKADTWDHELVTGIVGLVSEMLDTAGEQEAGTEEIAEASS